MKVLVGQSCPILWDPKDCSPPGSSVHSIWHWLFLATKHEGSSFRDQEWNMDPLPNTVKGSLNLWTAREAPLLPFFEKKKKKRETL